MIFWLALVFAFPKDKIIVRVAEKAADHWASDGMVVPCNERNKRPCIRLNAESVIAGVSLLDIGTHVLYENWVTFPASREGWSCICWCFSLVEHRVSPGPIRPRAFVNEVPSRLYLMEERARLILGLWTEPGDFGPLNRARWFWAFEQSQVILYETAKQQALCSTSSTTEEVAPWACQPYLW